jgi:hypothetical protein
VLTKRDIKVSFISITVFALCFILFNQGIDEAAAYKNKQIGQQSQTELVPLNIDQFAAILENQQIATKGDIGAMQKELETFMQVRIRDEIMDALGMNDKNSTLLSEITDQHHVICTRVVESRGAGGPEEWESTCGYISNKK